MVGDNRIELVPQRTQFEGAKRRTNCRESRMQEVKYHMTNTEIAQKKTSWSISHDIFLMVGDNRIELLTFCL